MTKQLVIDALEHAVSRQRPKPGLIHHSDRGSQYASYAYQDALKKYGIITSMSRKGNCYDNACAESFFSTLKDKLIYLTKFKTREEARLTIFEYMRFTTTGFGSTLDWVINPRLNMKIILRRKARSLNSRFPAVKGRRKPRQSPCP